jgi:hypothetical protein
MATRALLLALTAAAACSAPERPRDPDPAKSGIEKAKEREAVGVVTAVRRGGFLLAISVGSSDGVRVGDIYSISRGKYYVCQLVITTVDKNQSVGEVDLVSGAPPQVGDKATPGGPK